GVGRGERGAGEGRGGCRGAGCAPRADGHEVRVSNGARDRHGYGAVTRRGGDGARQSARADSRVPDRGSPRESTVRGEDRAPHESWLSNPVRRGEAPPPPPAPRPPPGAAATHRLGPDPPPVTPHTRTAA